MVEFAASKSERRRDVDESGAFPRAKRTLGHGKTEDGEVLSHARQIESRERHELPGLAATPPLNCLLSLALYPLQALAACM